MFVERFDALLAIGVGATVIPVSLYLLLSGLDDFVHDLFSLLARRPTVPPKDAPERLTAILIPLWNEHRVIGRMLRHNLAAVRYSAFECFVGVYPNDRKTVRAVQELARELPRIHLALLPHDGPTVKADCLNWAFQHLLLYEEQAGVRFDNIVVHDAEDLLHPGGIAAINRGLAVAGMVQFPILPLPTSLFGMTRGLYCDDFAEGQYLHLEARVQAGAFLPGCGVGSGFRREVLDHLGAASANQIFDPHSLTEDYDIGFRIHQMGFPQLFLPLRFPGGRPAATRELFPPTMFAAIRQRTRWITGNSLQSWAKHGWGSGRTASRVNRYFLWRDRKGLWGNPISLFCNLVLAYAIFSWLRAQAAGGPWIFGQAIPHHPLVLFITTLNSLFFVERLTVRVAACARIYGFRFAALAPIRMLWGNWINAAAAVWAVAKFARAVWRHEPLRWLKTEHAYPTRAALLYDHRPLGEILVQSAYVESHDLKHALASQRPGQRIGSRLVEMGALDETQLYEALSLQSMLPFVHIDPFTLEHAATRALPRWMVRKHQTVPFRIDATRLHVATPELPSEETIDEVGRMTALGLAFHLVTPSNFHALQSQVAYEEFR